MTSLGVIKHFRSTMPWWVSTSTRPCSQHLTLIAACVNRSFAIWCHTRQKVISSHSMFFFTSLYFATWAVYTFETAISKNHNVTVGDDDNIDSGRECQRISLRYLVNILQMHLSIKYLPKGTSTAWLLMTQGYTRTRRSPILTNICMIPSMGTAWLMTVQKLG